MSKDNNLPKKIMIVDNSPIGIQEVKEFLEKQGIQTLTAPDHASAMYSFNTNKVDVTVIALELQDASGLSLLQKMRESGDDITKKSAGVVMASGKKERTTAELNLLREFGNIEIIQRPYKGIQLLPYLARAMKQAQIEFNFLNLKRSVVDVHVQAGDYDRAIAEVEKVLPQIGDRGEMMMLELLEKAQIFDKAIQACDRILAKNKNNIVVIGAKGRLLLKTIFAYGASGKATNQ